MKHLLLVLAIGTCLAGCASSDRDRSEREGPGDDRLVGGDLNDDGQRAVEAAADDEDTAATPQGYALDSSAGGYRVVFLPAPDDLPLNEMFSMDVWLLDGAKLQPIDDVTLVVDAAMPAHRHGMNTMPRVTPQGGGHYTVQGMLLHMSGDWELYFDVTRDGITERAQVPVTLE